MPALAAGCSGACAILLLQHGARAGTTGWHQQRPACWALRRSPAARLDPVLPLALPHGLQTPDARVRTYADVMREAQLQRERDNTMRNIQEKQRREAEELAALDAVPTKASGMAAAAAAAAAPAAAAPSGKRSRWDSAAPVDA